MEKVFVSENETRSLDEIVKDLDCVRMCIKYRQQFKN